MRFEMVTPEGTIGWSELEHGDPPKGLAYGRFHPTALYQASRHAGPDADLHARPEGSEEYFRPSGGVFIEDLSAEFGPEEIEVSVIGLDAETYERFFPEHLTVHEQQFRSR